MQQHRLLSSYLEEVGYLNQTTRLTNGAFIQSTHVSSARQALISDRESLYKNALIAYCGVFKMILSKNYSWAFVHSHYSVFYLFQVLLAFNDVSLCYDQGKPFSIKLTEGSQFKKEEGNTHKSIFGLFKYYYGNDSEICSEINGKKVCDWFDDMRNKVNYRTVPQMDPNVSYGLYDFNEANDIRKMASIYFEDIDMYAYTPEHAYVAYPLLLIRKIVNLYGECYNNCELLNDADFLKYLADNIRDSKGPITPVIELVKKGNM